MTLAESPPDRGWLGPVLVIALLVTGLRVVGLWFNATDLFVDEAQYWLWGQTLDFGYYSKPPMIAWVIRAFTEVCGNGPFCVRLPAPVLHGLTSVVIGAAAALLAGRRAAIVTAAAYLTTPMVALGSLLISTDTVMYLFLALAFLAYLRCLRGASAGVALAGGIALGLAFLSKYAAIYLVICAVLAAPLRPRLSWGQAGAFLLGFAVGAAPNVLWNVFHGGTTLEHTLDNADWVRDPSARAALNLSGLAEFFFAQFAVFGPVLFAGLLILTATWARRGAEVRRLLLFSLPIVAVVCVQAVISRAYANWAVAGYLAGVLVVVPWLMRASPAWLRVSFAVNLVFCLVLPVATVLPALIAPGGHSVVERYLGRAGLSRAIIAEARAQGLTVVVAADRDMLADLFYTGRDSGLVFRAVPPKGRPANHYEQRFPYDGGASEQVLFVGYAGPAPCAEAEPLGEIAPVSGAYRGRRIAEWQVPGACFG